MAGRKRRFSESSVEPPKVNKSKIKWLKEIKVSRHRNPFQILVLKDVIIYRNDLNTMVNPLYLTHEGPCHVRGQLEAPDTEQDLKEQQKHLLDPRFRDAHIEIRNSGTFAIGTGDCELPVLWMLGDRGYYEIKPSRDYEAVYNEVCDAISLYFGIIKAYEAEMTRLLNEDPDVIAESAGSTGHITLKNVAKRPKLHKKLKRTKLAQIFWLYAREMCDGVLLSDIETLCHRFAPFLVPHLDLTDGDFNFTGTEFRNWIRLTHPDIVGELDTAQKRIQAGLPPATPASQQATDKTLREGSNAADERGQASLPQPLALTAHASKGDPSLQSSRVGRSSRQSSQHDDVEMKDATPLRQRFRAEPLGGPRQRTNCPSALTTPSVPDMRVSPVTTHLSPVDKILLVLEEIGAEYKDLQKPQAQAVLNKLYFKCKIVQYGTHGEIVAYYSSELVDRLDSRWHGTPFWNWLVAESLKPNKKLVNSTVESIPSQLERRRKKPDTSSPASTTPASTQFEDARVPDPARHQGKRPGDVYAGTGGLRPPGSALKRSFSELDEESASGSGRSRRPARQSNVANYHSDGFMELDVDKAKGAEEDAGLQAKGNGQDIKVDKASQGDHGFLPPFPKDAVPIVFNAFREPATQPTGPNGTWVCEQELCGFVVRDAEVEAGLEKIRRHFRDHEHESERLELARAEALRGHQSINHLLDKIQAKSRRVMEAEIQSGGERKAVAPVRRRLMV